MVGAKSLWYPLADSATLQYDTVQLNRIEWMLMQLMVKLSSKDDALTLFDSHDSAVPHPFVSGPLDTEDGGKLIGRVSKSRQRRMRMAQTMRGCGLDFKSVWMVMETLAKVRHKMCF